MPLNILCPAFIAQRSAHYSAETCTGKKKENRGAGKCGAAPATSRQGGDDSMRILHAAPSSIRLKGARFFNCEYKLQAGLAQLGHFPFHFSLHDHAHANFLQRRCLGRAFTNRALIETCANFRPDVLLLGHAQVIEPDTLAGVRARLPGIKIGLWYVDPVFAGEPYRHLFPKLPYLDALFVTTGGVSLTQFREAGCRAAFIPNPSDPSVENLTVDAVTEPPAYDLVFTGSDNANRRPFITALDAACRSVGIRFALAGLLGHPKVYGAAKDDLLKRSLCALNLSQWNDVALYSSDRISQLVGNGLCTLSVASSGLQALFEPDREMVFFDGTVEGLVAQMKALTADPARARAIGRAGREKTTACYSAKAVARFMIDFLFDSPAWRGDPIALADPSGLAIADDRVKETKP